MHGSAATEAVLEDPYSLTAHPGIGFHSADRLAVANGVDRDSPSRTARRRASTRCARPRIRGHTHLPRAELSRGDVASCSAPSRLLASTLEGDDAIEIEDGRDLPRVDVAAPSAGWRRRWPGWRAAEPAWSKPPIEGEGRRPDRAAGRGGHERADPDGCRVITGGPGTGKTHLTHALVADGGDAAS